MKIWLGAVGAAVLLAAAAAWLWTSSSPRLAPAATASAPAKPAPPPGVVGRVFLSNAQVKEALSSGTLGRPVRSILPVQGRMRFGDFAWDDRGVPAGPTWIRVDLKAQLISVFRGPHEIGTAVIVYGGDNKETPAGKLHILAKAKKHRSSLYEAEMPYTLRLTDDGVSIHGSTVRWGAATHGCVGVPLPFAERLFAATKVGDEVEIVAPEKTS